MKSKLLLLAALFFSFLAFAVAQAGALDASFGESGIVQLPIDASNNDLYDIVIQEDGKIVVGGYESPDAILIRLHSDGSLDDSFGEGGIVISNFGFYFNMIYAIALQPDGKIVAVARGNMNFSNNARLFVVRYNEDGTYDDTFGENGKVLVDTGYYTSIGRAIAIQPDGKIIAGAQVNNSSSNNEIVVTRLQTNGQLDTSFGTNGIQVVPFGDQPGLVYSVVLQSNQKIVLGGYLKRPESTAYDSAVGRLLEDGTIDTDFGDNGVVITPVSTKSNNIRELLILPDNRILAIGGADLGSENSKVSIIRYHPNGSMDTNFGTNGFVLTGMPNKNTTGRAGILQPDGKILVGGGSQGTISNGKFVLYRYLPDGTLDNTFGDEGIVLTEVTASSESISAIALQHDGKVVAAGEIYFDDFIIARYLNDLDVGTLDFSITQNDLLVYPNPIKETGHLKYTLLRSENISLQLFDINGNLLRTYLDHEYREEGLQEETFSFPLNAPSGAYVLVLSTIHGRLGVKIIR